MPIPDPEALEAALVEARGDGNGRLYALLDGARSPEIHAFVTATPGHECLYKGSLSPELERAAPFLVEPQGKLLDHWLARAWGQSWGIFLTADAEPEALVKHFRRFLKVKSEDGEVLVFRFYDPRVFRPYLPTCTAEEAEFVFGPVARFLVEAEDGEGLLGFSREDGAVTESALL